MRAHEINPQAELPRFVLPANTFLYHGTNATDDFDMVHDRPSWFTLDETLASDWRNWHQSDHRNQGAQRTLEFATTRSLVLWDMRTGDVESIMVDLVGDPEPSPYYLASHLPEDFDGWIAESEVMIVEPLSALRFVKKSY